MDPGGTRRACRGALSAAVSSLVAAILTPRNTSGAGKAGEYVALAAVFLPFT
jgi:hypothetical protein